MSSLICPNKNLPEWKALVNHPDIGEFEANRDFMQYNGEIRTPEQVIERIQLDIKHGPGWTPEDIERHLKEPDLTILDSKAGLRPVLKKEQDILEQRILDTKSVRRWNGLLRVKQHRYGEAQKIVNQLEREFGYKIAELKPLTEDINGVGGRKIYKIILNKPIEKPATNTPGEQLTMFYREHAPSELELNDPLIPKDPLVLSPDQHNTTRAIEITTKMIDRLSSQHGIDYRFVTQEEAEKITEDARSPWNGEPAFYIGDTVYFINDKLRLDIALHEFSHPLVRAISHLKDTSLFNNLYSKALATSEGTGILNDVITLYPDLDRTGDLFKEEVIVRALTLSAQNRLNSIPESTGFKAFITNLLYHIKQILRKAFGKINIEKLNPNTSLDQLGDMLLNENFQLNKDTLSDKDVIAYARDYTEYKDTLVKMRAEDVQHLTDQLYKGVNAHLNMLKERKDYPGMLDLVKDNYTQEKLELIRKDLSKYHKSIERDVEDLREDFNINNPLMSNMASSLYRLQDIANRMTKTLDAIPNNPTKGDVYVAEYAREVIKDWTNIINGGKQAIVQNVGRDNALWELLNRIEGSLKSNIVKIQEVELKGTVDIQLSTLKSTMEFAEKTHNDQIVDLEKRNASPDLISKIKKSYDDIKLTPEKISKILNGELGDANSFYSYFGGFASNRDPVIASFGMFIKNNMTDVETKALSFANNFWTNVTPLVKDADISTVDPKVLANKISFVDKSDEIDKETGKIIVKEVRTLLSPHKDYRFAIAEMEEKIKEARIEYADTKTPESKLKLAELRQERAKHINEYFFQENTDELHSADYLFDTPLGAEAKLELDTLWSALNTLEGTLSGEIDRLEVNAQMDQIFRDVRQLYSTLDLNGNTKTGDALAKVMLLKQYREATKDFYEWKERPNAFNRTLLEFEQSLVDKGIPKDSELFNLERTKWLAANTRTVIKKEFWETRKDISNRLRVILDRLPATVKNKVDITKALETITEAVYGFKDNDGQPQGNLLSEGRIDLVRKNQEFINKAKEEFAGLSGLTTLEMDELSELFDTIKSGERLGHSDRVRFDELLNKKNTLGLNKLDKAELMGLFAELAELQHKEATDYYVDIFNNYLTKVDTNKLFAEFGSRSITTLTAETVLKSHLIDELLSQNSDFKTWFNKNHVIKKTFIKETQKQEDRWERLYIWNVTKPNDQKYIETTDIKDEEDNVLETIKGTPSLRFYKREVLAEFKTAKIIGQTVDSFGKWLPRPSKLEGSEYEGVELIRQAPDDRYRNHAYFDLKKNDPKSFEVLEEIKKQYLNKQSEFKKETRRYLDLPTYRPDNIEIAQRVGYGQAKKNAITTWFDKVKSHFITTADDMEEGMNPDVQVQLLKADGFDNELSRIPVGGNYDLPIDQVSLDIPLSIMKYVFSAERQKKLIEINPVASALKNVLLDQGIKNIKETDKNNLVNRVLSFTTKKGQSVRSAAVDAYYAREFYGEQNTGITKDMKGIDAVVRMMSHTASFGMFAMNIPSALKNSFSAMVQNMIEASAGQYLNINTYHQGMAWSGKASMDISMELYKGTTKGLNVQLIETFNPSSTRLQETFGKNLSRSIFKDAVNFSWLFSPRKFTELNATLGLFGGMMYHKKINQTVNGQTQEISYIDAWEIKDGQLTLKKGIDPSWGIEGENFKQFRSTIQQVSNKLNGAFSRFDAPLMDRYLPYRMISFMRRYFPAMASNRFAPERLDLSLGESSRGYYLDAITGFVRTMQHGAKYLQWMSPREKKAFLRLFTEVGQIVGISLAMSMLFGWDPDDKDRYEKLRQKSGSPSFLPGVAEDPEHPFSMEGYMSNHTLNLMMNVRAESIQWIPVPGVGLQDYLGSLDWNSVMFGPTINTYAKMMNDMVNVGNEAGYYKRDVGPYEWQKEDELKLWNHMAKTIGISGSSIDPVLSIKNYQSIRARK